MSGTRDRDVIRLRHPSAWVWAVLVPAGFAAGLALQNPGSWLGWVAVAGIGQAFVRMMLAPVRVDESGVRVWLSQWRSARFDWGRVRMARVPEPRFIWCTPVLVLVDGTEFPMPPLRCRRTGPNRRYADRAVEMISSRALVERAQQE